MEQIPLLDLKVQFQNHRDEILTAITEVIESTAFIQGPYVEKFSRAFLDLHGGEYGTGCSNGTTAIMVALRALGVGHGDEVLVPNNTFFGTAEPVVELGAKPVLVEIDPYTYTMDLRDLTAKMTSNTKVIIPVHLYGNVEPMDTIMSIARDHGLKVIEDCAQAHLAKWNGQAVGTFGDFGTFSFYPGKNLGAYGDGGFIIAKDKRHFEFVKKFIDHGRQEKYLHDMFAGNYRMDAIQAAVLGVKLKYLEEGTQARQAIAAFYDQTLKARGFKMIEPKPEASTVYHCYIVEVSNRDEVMKHLKNQGIASGIHYPIPLSVQPAFSSLGYGAGQFLSSEKVASRIMSLPIYPEMDKAMQERVLAEFLKVAQP